MLKINPQERNIIDTAKLLLMLGVVLIHSNFSTNFKDISPIGKIVMLWGSVNIAGCCVPIFFILSGFLFFHNIDKFSKTVYLSKLHSRIRSLLIPYILWNLVAAVLFIFKVKVLGFPGYDVIVDNHIRVLHFIKGFWDLNNGYPYEFSFWFIRSLMIFVVLSPLVWLIASDRRIIASLFMVLLVFDIDLYGIEYFALGATFARQGKTAKIYDSKYVTLLFLGVTLLMIPTKDIEWINGRIELVRNLSGALVLLKYSKYLTRQQILCGKFGKSLVNSAFIIYAVHSLYCSIVKIFLAEHLMIGSAVGCIT